jgi:hypothetical protein
MLYLLDKSYMFIVIGLGLVRQAHYKSATYRKASIGFVQRILDD